MDIITRGALKITTGDAEIFFGPTNQRYRLFFVRQLVQALMIKNAQNKMKKENPPNYLFTTWQVKGHFGMCSYSVGAPTL